METEDSKKIIRRIQKLKIQKKTMANRSQKQIRLGDTNAPMKPMRMDLAMKECSKSKARKITKKADMENEYTKEVNDKEESN